MPKTIFLVLFLLTATSCSSGSSTPGLQPEIQLLQLPGSEFLIQSGGSFTIRFAMEIANPSETPVELERVELRVMGEGPYTLQTQAVQIRKVIEPGSSETVEFPIDAVAVGGRLSPKEPVMVRGTAHFGSSHGPFRVNFSQVVKQP